MNTPDDNGRIEPRSTTDTLDGGGEPHVDGTGAPSPAALNLRGERIARSSCWVAVMGIGLALLASKLQPNPSTGTIIVLASAVLLVVSALLAIIALLGTRKWGRVNVVGPATGGLVVSGLMLVMMINSAVKSSSVRRAEEARKAEVAQRTDQLLRDAEHAFMEAGWLGLSGIDGVGITVTSMPKDSPLCTGMLTRLNTNAAVALVGTQNAGQKEVVVDTAATLATLEDGTQVPALDLVAIINKVGAQREELLKTYAPPLHVPASGGASTLLLFPPTLDWSRVHSLAISVNGTSQIVRGQYLTADQKHQVVRPQSQPAGAPR